MDERALDILLRIGLDRGALQRASKGLEGVRGLLRSLEKDAEELRREIAKALDAKQETRALVAQLEQVEAQIRDVQQAAREQARQGYMDQVRAGVQGMQQQAEQLERIGTRVGLAGAAILKGMWSSAEGYAQAMGGLESGSANWLAATREMEAAQTRLGRVSAEAMLPYKEALVKVMNSLAELGERSPGVAKALAAIGLGRGGSGGLAPAVAQGLRITADAKLLLAARMMNTAANKMETAAFGMQMGGGKNGVAGALGGLTAANVAMGVKLGILGVAITALTAFLTSKEGEPVRNAAGQSAAMGLGLLGASLGFIVPEPILNWGQGKTLNKAEWIKELGTKWFLSTARFTGVLKDEDEELAAQANDPAIKAYTSYREAEVEAEKQYQEERLRIVKDYQEQLAEVEKNYQKERARAAKDFAEQERAEREEYTRSQARELRDFLASQQQAEADYYRERMKAAADFGRETERMEEEHQREMRYLQEDHQTRLQDMLERGDVRGIEQELRDYERERRRAEEGYGASMGERNEEYAAQVAQAEREFALQQEQRQKEFDQRRADEAEDYKLRRAEAKKQFDAEMMELDARHREELGKLQRAKNEALRELDERNRKEYEKRHKAFVDQLADLGVFLEGEMKQRRAYYDQMAKDLQNFLGVGGGTDTTKGSRASGGYVKDGFWRMHVDEFVLNRQTTGARERSTGGR